MSRHPTPPADPLPWLVQEPAEQDPDVLEGVKILRAAILGGIPGVAILWAVYTMLPS